MALSPYVAWLRSNVGTELVLLPCVTVLVRDERARLLLVRHTGFDKWATIGGMVEPEEHPFDAVAREVREETGFEVAAGALVHAAGGPDYTITYPNGDRVSYVTSVYTARLTGGIERLEADEVQEVGWFADDELPALDIDRFSTRLLTELGLLP